MVVSWLKLASLPYKGSNVNCSEKMNAQIEADIKEVLSAHNEFQRQKIARGEKPDYYPDAPRSNIRCRYQNYP